MNVRRAIPDDAAAIADVHVQSWKETYQGLMPDTFLERMTNAQAQQNRSHRWMRQLEQPTAGEMVFVALQESSVVAFASCGPARYHPDIDGELYALYALKAAQGLGLGRALFEAVCQFLTNQGHTSMALWVLDTNPTRVWYKRRGGVEAGEKVQPIPEGELREVRLVWPALSPYLA